MSHSIPSRPQSSYHRPTTAMANRRTKHYGASRPASAVAIPSNGQSTRPQTASRPTSTSTPTYSSSPSPPSPTPSAAPFTLDLQGRPRPTAVSIIANSMTTHLRADSSAPEMAFKNKELQELFNLYIHSGRTNDVDGQPSVAPKKSVHAAAHPTPPPPPSTTIGGVKKNVVLLRPKSARLSSTFSSTRSASGSSHHGSAFGRTTYPVAALSTHVEPSTQPISLDDVDDTDDYPDMNGIPVPTTVTFNQRKATFRELGAHFDDTGPARSWQHAAETRGIPLEVDREQAALGRDLARGELERRRLIHVAKAHRAELEKRDKPWRSNDIYSVDVRWSSKDHKDQVKQLNCNLDEMLKTWRSQQQNKNTEFYTHLPERDYSQPGSDPESAAGLPTPSPNAVDVEQNDMLYRLMMKLENQMEELRVYNQIFEQITRPTRDISHPDSSIVCPSLPLCDLLDRIRHAHTAFYPQFSELFVEVRRRLKWDWLIGEMGRKKDQQLEATSKEIQQWEKELDQEHKRSIEISNELNRIKNTLVSYTDRTYFDAPPSKATMVYDTVKRKLLHLESAAQVDELAEQPTLWYGEVEYDDADDTARHKAESNGSRSHPSKRVERIPSAGTIAWKNDRAERKLAKINARLEIRARRREEERKYRTQRIEELRRRAKVNRMLSPNDEAELRHLLQADERARQLAIDGEEKLIVSSSDEDDSDSDAELDSNAAIAAREQRLALLSPTQRVKKLYSRVDRAVVRALTTRPLLHIRPLETGSKVGGRVFCNSDYYSFEIANSDPGVWIRLFATEAGSSENHIELQLAYGAPPTRSRRFFVTSTQGVTHCHIDLRNFEMRREREERDQASGVIQDKSGAMIQSTPSRWYLRVIGRGLSMKAYAMEFRIQTSLIDYSSMIGAALEDMDTQLDWQAALHEKVQVIEQLAQDKIATFTQQHDANKSSGHIERCREEEKVEPRVDQATSTTLDLPASSASSPSPPRYSSISSTSRRSNRLSSSSSSISSPTPSNRHFSPPSTRRTSLIQLSKAKS